MLLITQYASNSRNIDILHKFVIAKSIVSKKPLSRLVLYQKINRVPQVYVEALSILFTQLKHALLSMAKCTAAKS